MKFSRFCFQIKFPLFFQMKISGWNFLWNFPFLFSDEIFPFLFSDELFPFQFTNLIFQFFFRWNFSFLSQMKFSFAKFSIAKLQLLFRWNIGTKKNESLDVPADFRSERKNYGRKFIMRNGKFQMERFPKHPWLKHF